MLWLEVFGHFQSTLDNHLGENAKIPGKPAVTGIRSKGGYIVTGSGVTCQELIESYTARVYNCDMTATLEANNFKLIGGSASLDFVNTVGGWGGSPSKKGAHNYRDAVLNEKLESYSNLVVWGRYARLLTDREARRLLRLAKQRPQVAQAVLERALKLRRAIYRLFKSVSENWRADEADVDQLNEELSVARNHEMLTYADNKFSWDWDARVDALEWILWPLALSAAQLLTSGNLSRIRQCGGENCGWLFLDTSRNHSRQWCAMNDCGNLAKVRRFRQRQRKGS